MAGNTVEFIDTVAHKQTDEPATKPSLVKAKFTSDFIKMFEAAPKNEFVRGWILKTTKKMPPEDIDSMDKLESWLDSIQPKNADVSPVVNNRPGGGFVVQLSITEIESGRRDYTVRNRGTMSYDLNEEQMRSLVQTAIDEEYSMEDLLASLSDRVAEDVWERPMPAMEADDDTLEYGDWHNQDTSDQDWDYLNDVQTKVEEWVRINMPEAIEPLGM